MSDSYNLWLQFYADNKEWLLAAFSGFGLVLAATIFRFGGSLWQWLRPTATASDLPAISPEQARRNRANMLTQVETAWIKGVLEKSLHGAVLLELGLKEQPGLVHRPWDTLLKIPGEADQLLPPDQKLLDIFDQSAQALLILGEPRSRQNHHAARSGPGSDRPGSPR